MTKADNTTRPVNFIRFHGLTLLVVENGGVEYIKAKALTDLIGLDWRTARRTLTGKDNTHLYGTRELDAPELDGLGGLKPTRTPVSTPSEPALETTGCPETGGSTPSNEAAGGDITPRNGALYVRLDRSRMFVARISTDRMRANGNDEAADFVLKLQIEWAEALHQYETNGVAIKKGHKDTQAELATLYKLRVLAETPAERQSLSALIAEAFAALGHPLDADSQQSLPLGQ